MRLIDADEHKNQLCKDCTDRKKYKNFCPCGRIFSVDKVKTAFDLNKVLEDIEHQRFVAFITLANAPNIPESVYENISAYIDKVADIVRRGGIDE